MNVRDRDPRIEVFVNEITRCFGAPPASITMRQGEIEMPKAYDNTNRGVLFRETDKQSDEDRDYSGSINIAGSDYWLSGWLKTSKKKGTKFLSLSVKPKEEQKAKPDIDDDIEF